MDPAALVVEALTAAGHASVHSANAERGFGKEALSSPEYVWVEEQLGTTPFVRYSDRPTIEIVVYSNLGVAEATRRAREILTDLQNAQGNPLPSGGIHRVITVIRPYRQDLPGVPADVGRAILQVDLILSTKGHW